MRSARFALGWLLAVALVAPPGAGAASPSAPSATTSPAGSITQTSAKLRGAVNPHGLPTTYSFQYGTTKAYSANTPSTLLPDTGNSTKPVSFTVGGLGPATRYHFRLVASNALGTKTGSDRSFTTRPIPPPPPGPPTVITGPPLSITQSSVVLSGTISPNRRATTYFFQLGPTVNYNTVTPTTGAGSSGTVAVRSPTIAGLQPGTLYHYRLVASNSLGTRAGVDRTFTSGQIPVPVVTGFGIVPSTFRVQRAGTVGFARRIHRGSAFVFGLSEPATVSIRIDRRLPGKLDHGRCRAPRRSLGRNRGCLRDSFAGTLTRDAHPGVDTIHFTGREASGRPLAAGLYRATILAFAAGQPQRSAPQSARFRIVAG